MLRHDRPNSVLIFLTIALIAAVASAADLSVRFNGQTLNQPPRNAECSGPVRVVQHPEKSAGDLCVALSWSKADEKPRMTLRALDGKFPLRGIVLFDLLIHKHGGAFHLRGMSNRNRELFVFRVGSDGKAASVAADGTAQNIVCVAGPPVIDQWYSVQLTYNQPARAFNVLMDGNWKSGDTPARAVGDGEFLERVVFSGEGEGESAYYVDAIRVLAAEDAKPDQRLHMPVECSPRKVRWETPLAPANSAQRALVVYPSGIAGSARIAQKIAAAAAAKSGRELVCISDTAVTDPQSWLLREEYLHRPMIVLGNATDSRAMYALATRFLTVANRKWPGEDKHCVRTAFEPFLAGTNWVVVEASTLEGLEAGADALCKRLATTTAADLTLPLFRDLGRAKGQWKVDKWDSGGIDTSKPIADIKEQFKKKYGENVLINGGSGVYYFGAFHWLAGADSAAAKFAAAVLLLEIERNPLAIHPDHYNFDDTIKAWRACFSSGVVDEELLNQAEAAIVRRSANAAYYGNDWFADNIRHDRGRLCSYATGRHWMAMASNFIIGTEYALTHCRMGPVTRAVIEDYDAGYAGAGNRLTDMFRPMEDTAEIGDCNSMNLNLQAHLGNLAYARNGALTHAAELYMATTNNLGVWVGEGAYIGSGIASNSPGRLLIGAAAFYTKDPQLQWLWNNMKGTYWCVTARVNPIYDDIAPERYPDRYVGMYALPYDPNVYRTVAAPAQVPEDWRRKTIRPPSEPIERLYDCAFFRDGFEPKDAFLMMYGSQHHRVMIANTIPQYTDLGQTLLFASMQMSDRWCRTAASASNGLPSMPSDACIKKAALSSKVASILSSTNPRDGGTESTRTIIHRFGHYFVVLDSFKALAEDDYSFTCRWRAPHPSKLEGGVWTEQAPGGVTFRLASADPVKQESTWEDFDGGYRPYMLTQNKQARLKTGQTVQFRNMFYASSDQRLDEYSVYPVDDHAIVIRGGRSGKNPRETAIVGTDRSPETLKGVEVQADVYFMSDSNIVAANATKVVVNGKSLLDSATPKNVEIDVKDQKLSAALDDVCSRAIMPKVAPPGGHLASASPSREYGLSSAWQYRELELPPVEYVPVFLAASRPSWAHPAEELLSQLWTPHVTQVHNAVAWSSDQGPVTLTMDLGQARDLTTIRLFGTIENGFARKYYWKDGDLQVKATFSDDNFQKDIRLGEGVKSVFRECNFPRSQYKWASRIPELDLLTSVRARYVRLEVSAKTPHISLQKIILLGKDREKRLITALKAADLDGDGSEELLVKTSINEIAALSAAGKKLWSRTLNGEITAWNAVHLDNAKAMQMLAYTSEDLLYVMDSQGKDLWKKDFYEHSKVGTEDSWARSNCRYIFSDVQAWHPDKDGRKEIVGLAMLHGITIRQDKSVSEAVVSQAQFLVPDTSVYGKEVMLYIASDITVRDHEGKLIVNRPLKGGGFSLFPALLWGSPVVEGDLKGFAAVSRTSVDWAPADGGAGWGEASDIPIGANLLADVNGDGKREILAGFVDGFVRAYRIADGKIVGKVCAGSPVTGLAMLGKNLIVATRDNVRMYDPDLKEIGSLNISAVAATAVAGPRPMVCVTDQAGVVHALTLP